MTNASKTAFCLNNLKILRPKVTKILQICLKELLWIPSLLVFLSKLPPPSGGKACAKIIARKLMYFYFKADCLLAWDSSRRFQGLDTNNCHFLPQCLPRYVESTLYLLIFSVGVAGENCIWEWKRKRECASDKNR